MNYRILPESLRDSADIVHRYLSRELGCSKIFIEEPFDDAIEYRPTFWANTRDFHILCVDVSENVYNPTRLAFVYDCEKQGKPVKLTVALPSTAYGNFATDLKAAKKASVGILEINTVQGSCNDLNTPLSLSLTGLRNFDKTKFPKKYREHILHAETTFKNGDPNKACSIVYDEIEALSRRIAVKSYKDGCWKNTISNPNDLNDKMPWSQIMIHLRDDLDRGRASRYKDLNPTLIAKIYGATSYRNDSGHKTNSRRALINRDTQLRTRIESAVDLLQEYTEAIKDIKL